MISLLLTLVCTSGTSLRYSGECVASSKQCSFGCFCLEL